MWYNGIMNAQQEAIRYTLTHELDYTKLMLRLMIDDPVLVIDLLAPDMDRFAADFLKRDPEQFLKLAKQFVTGIQRMREIKAFLTSGNLVGVIKLLREDTGLGLKEARDIICEARDRLVFVGKLPQGSQQVATSTTPKLNASDEAKVAGILAEFGL